ncbi:hypothetical protein BDN72DRAFT_284089 [Pluteus cervinus]|uniref:Uncharacterized protein n=1 Tax=Pluteus cervinus TaxID=181527 RepID=A0ACD3B594_9AGAR|nr:hypothetical protein BDN72DRAFT_284089 [Pluteus cervinus]
MAVTLYQNDSDYASGSTSQLPFEEVQTMLANLIADFDKKLENQRTDLSQETRGLGQHLENLQTQVNQAKSQHAEEMKNLGTIITETQTLLAETQVDRDKEKQRADQAEGDLKTREIEWQATLDERFTNSKSQQSKLQAKIDQTKAKLAEERERLETKLNSSQNELKATQDRLAIAQDQLTVIQARLAETETLRDQVMSSSISYFIRNFQLM